MIEIWFWWISAKFSYVRCYFSHRIARIRLRKMPCSKQNFLTNSLKPKIQTYSYNHKICQRRYFLVTRILLDKLKNHKISKKVMWGVSFKGQLECKRWELWEIELLTWEFGEKSIQFAQSEVCKSYTFAPFLKRPNDLWDRDIRIY